VILRECGARVTAVDTADAALEAVTRERPDVLVSDLEMPEKGDYWLIGQVRALSASRGGATPAAALTGLAGAQHRASALRAGFQYHLEKPVDLDALLGVVATLATPNFAGLPS
jgi:CheY-like chemotaxis protein